jgi:hypothetical protein
MSIVNAAAGFMQPSQGKTEMLLNVETGNDLEFPKKIEW